MRKSTVRHGLKLILFGILAVTAATFFHDGIARILFMGIAGDAQVTLFGFFIGGLLGGCGILVAAGGLLQSGIGERPVRLAPLFLLIVGSIFVFFFLVFHSFTTPTAPRLRPGESISI